MYSLMQIQEMKQTEKKKKQQTRTQCEQQQKQGWRMAPRKTWVSENFGRISKSRKRF